MFKISNFLLVLCLVRLCVPMIGKLSSPKNMVKPRSAELNSNKKIMNSLSMPTSQKLSNSLRTYGHNSLLYNFQTYNEDLKYPKNRRNSHVVKSSISRSSFWDGIKIRFNYGNQLKIMLENSIEYKNKRKFLSLQIVGTIEEQSPGQGYNVSALQAAVEKEEEILMGPQIGGFEHILKIATVMMEAINQLNAAAIGPIPERIKIEQLRFIGLVLAHLVLRDDPIVDPETGDYVFIAQMEPSIDPMDPHVWRQMREELDTQIRAQLTCQQILVEQKHADGILAEKELFEHLNSKIMRGIPKSADLAKWRELAEKFRLISLLKQKKLPHFNLIFRTFIAFGEEAPKLILLVRVLLEGAIDEYQFANFLKKGSNADLLTFIQHMPSEILSKQLKSVAKQFGF